MTVRDTTPPTINAAAAIPSVLWPPNHKMAPVSLSVSVSDTCNTAAACQIAALTSDEPVNGLGDGDTTPDWQITGNLTTNLRAERSGSGKGRVYTIMIQCTDMSGNSSSKSVTVTVPHNR